MKPQTAIILVNLGSPDSPDTAAVRRYLAQFLHDRRVIQTTRWIWCPILHGIILRTRPAKSAAKYAKIWNDPKTLSNDQRFKDEAPLIRITRNQAEALQARLKRGREGETLRIEIAMRYGQPSISSVLSSLVREGVDQFAILPLYPQYSKTTTASVQDAVDSWLGSAQNGAGTIAKPTRLKLNLLQDYHDHPLYIQALKNGIRGQIDQLGWSPDVLIASYHGIPLSYADAGDPYPQQCERTTELLRASLDDDMPPLLMTYQSRFGRLPWLQPYTSEVLQRLPSEGKKNVLMLTPGFAADCLETLEEINIEARETFMKAGGARFAVAPCLNDDRDHIDLLEALARNELFINS